MPTFLFLSPPNSKCLHLLMASILLDLQLGSTHSSLNTIFFVVLALTRTQHARYLQPHKYVTATDQTSQESWAYLLSENRLGLTTIPALLSVVSPLTCRTQREVQFRVIIQISPHTCPHVSYRLFTLSVEGVLSLLVLGNFVGLVLLALLAVGPAGLRDVHLDREDKHWAYLQKHLVARR